MGGGARLAAGVAVLAFLHFALRPVFNEWFASPNLLVAALLIGARQVRPGYGAVLGFLLGLFEDAMAVSYFGMSMALLALLGYLGSRTRDLFLGEELAFMGAYLLCGTWIYEAVLHLVQGGNGLLMDLLVRAPAAALLTAVIGHLLLPLVRWR